MITIKVAKRRGKNRFLHSGILSVFRPLILYPLEVAFLTIIKRDPVFISFLKARRFDPFICSPFISFFFLSVAFWFYLFSSFLGN